MRAAQLNRSIIMLVTPRVRGRVRVGGVGVRVGLGQVRVRGQG